MAIETDKLAKAIAEAAEEYERKYGHPPAKARVTLSKSDSSTDTTETLTAFEKMQLHATEDEVLAKEELISKTQGNRRLAQVAKSIQKRGQTTAQAVLEALNSNPELYQP